MVHFSVLGNHVPLIAEATDRRALGRGMKGLLVRVARGVNRVTGRHGAVVADRFRARALRTPPEVRRALACVLLDARRHGVAGNAAHRDTFLDAYASGAAFEGWRTPPGPGARPGAVAPPPVAPAQSWLFTVGRRRHGLLAPDERSGPPG